MPVLYGKYSPIKNIYWLEPLGFGDWCNAGFEGEEKVKIKLSFLTKATTLKEMVDFSLWAIFRLLSYGARWWNPFLLFPLLSFPLPNAILFSRGFYIYIRNEIQFPELEIFCYFFFLTQASSSFISSLWRVMLQWDWFLSTWHTFFPLIVEFPHSILRMNVPSPGVNHRPESWLSVRNNLHRELCCKENPVLHKGVDRTSTEERESHWSWFIQ